MVKKLISTAMAVAVMTAGSVSAANMNVRADLNGKITVEDLGTGNDVRGLGILTSADYAQSAGKSSQEMLSAMVHVNQLEANQSSVSFHADMTDATEYTAVISGNTATKTEAFTYYSPDYVKNTFFTSLNPSAILTDLIDTDGNSIMNLYCGDWSSVSGESKTALANYFAGAMPESAEAFVQKSTSAVAALMICDVPDSSITDLSNPVDELVVKYDEELGIKALSEYTAYASASAEFKQILCARINSDKAQAVSDFATYFIEQYYLTCIQTSTNYSQINPILLELEAKCGLDLTAYNALADKKSKDTSLVGKTYADKAALATALAESTIAAPSAGGGGGGGGGGSKFTAPIVNDVSQTPTEEKPLYTDISAEHWANEAVTVLSGRGAISGYDNGEFRPNNNVTRAEFLAMLLRAFEFDNSETLESFTDVSENVWYRTYAAVGKKYGITGGYEDGTFRADNPVTRQEAACMIINLANVRAVALAEVREAAEFTDNADIAEYASESVQRLYCAGIINGYEDGSFAPTGYLTRAEAAQMIFSLLKANV